MNSSIEIYQTDHQTIEVRLDSAQDTVWLSQGQLVDLFQEISQLSLAMYVMCLRMQSWTRRAICRKCILLFLISLWRIIRSMSSFQWDIELNHHKV